MDGPFAGADAPLLLRRDGAVATLVLNRPDSRNALSEAMLAALSSACDELSEDGGVKAIVLTHVGPVFSAGHDLKEMTARRRDGDRGRAYFLDLMRRCAGVMQKLIALPQPVIAAVEGIATAAGCQLVATCDLAVAGANAKFATPGVNIGLFCSTPMVALTRAVPRKAAMEMLLTGNPLTAARAEALGLVNRVTPAGRALAEAQALGAAISAKSGATVRIGKRAFYAQIDMGLPEAYAYAAEVMGENMMIRDAEEGIDAFVERRVPAWRDA